MTATIIAIVILIVLYFWFRAYKRKKEYKIPTYYNTPTNYADLDHNQFVRKRYISAEIKKSANDKMIKNINEAISELNPSSDVISENTIIGNNTDDWSRTISNINYYTEPDNTDFSGGFGGGEFSGGGAGESWSDDNSCSSNDD